MFDVDGVLADFIRGFTEEAVKLGLLEKSWTTVEHPEWDFGNMNGEQIGKVWQRINHTPNWWVSLNAMPDVDGEVIKRINGLGSEVVYCTHREAGFPNTQAQTRRWLQSIGIDYPNVITSKRKGEVARALDITHAIDDKVENANCIHWISDVKPTKSYIINRLYNQQGRVRKLGVVNTVKEFLDAAGS